MGEVRDSDELLSRIELIESQRLENRATGYEQLYEEMLADLQRSDANTA